MRGELGTEKDGSMGAWGGKKYEGLGMRDVIFFYQFSNSVHTENKLAKLFTSRCQDDFNQTIHYINLI